MKQAQIEEEHWWSTTCQSNIESFTSNNIVYCFIIAFVAGYACRLLTPEMKLLICSEESLDVSNSRCQEKLKQNKFDYGSVLAHAFLPVVFFGSVHTLPENFENGISLWNASTVFRSHYPGGINKRNNYRPFWICVWGKLGQGDHVIIVTSLLCRSSVFKMFSVPKAKMQGRRFQIFVIRRAFWKGSVFVTD